MDDGAFPRVSARDGDDVLARDPLIGERDPRSEDRQVLLDAIMAATDHLVITYTGADDRTNEPRPPCVPLGELLDTLDAMAVTATGAPVRTRARVEHPLQPFDARNFTPGALGTPGPFSHDQPGLAGARAASLPRSSRARVHRRRPAAAARPRALAAGPGQLPGLPPATFLRTRIGIQLRGAEDRPPEAIPIELNGLAAWSIGERALRLILRGEPEAAVAAAELLRGHLPPGALGVAPLRAIGRDVTSLSARVRPCGPVPPASSGWRWTSTAGCGWSGPFRTCTGGSSSGPRTRGRRPSQELRLWPELLAAAACDPPAAAVPAAGWSARLVTRDGVVALDAPGPAESRRLLAELAALHDAGTVSALPVLAETSLAYAQRRARGASVSVSERAAQFGPWQAKLRCRA